MTQEPRATWEDLVGHYAAIRQELAGLSDKSYHRLTLPGVAAAPEEIAAAEARVGMPLDAQHKELLSVIDGWHHMFVSLDFLRAEQIGADLWRQGVENLAYVYEDGAGVPGVPDRGELFPFAVDPHSAATHVLWMGGPLTDGGHPVIWVHDEEVERYANLREWLLSQVKYEKRELDKLRAQHGRRP